MCLKDTDSHTVGIGVLRTPCLRVTHTVVTSASYGVYGYGKINVFQTYVHKLSPDSILLCLRNKKIIIDSRAIERFSD